MMQPFTPVQEYLDWLKLRFNATVVKGTTGNSNGVAKTSIKITIGENQYALIQRRDVLKASEMGTINSRFGIDEVDCPFRVLSPENNPDFEVQDAIEMTLDYNK